MTRYVVAGFIAFSACLGPLMAAALAHNTWISRGAHQGKGQAAGEWCCGEGDCGELDKGSVTAASDGYRVRGYVTIMGTKARIWIEETVPYSEAQPSPDGIYWHCHRPNMTRRCFFAPPPGS
jgi:hypothetical protein